jgi:hypothetical protein
MEAEPLLWEQRYSQLRYRIKQVEEGELYLPCEEIIIEKRLVVVVVEGVCPSHCSLAFVACMQTSQ